MEPCFVIAAAISIFCHQMELCYDPAGYVGLESTLFIMLSFVAINKLVGSRNAGKTLWDMAADVMLACLTMQFLLVTVWYVIFCSLQTIVEAVFNSGRRLLGATHIEQFKNMQPYVLTLSLLAVEMVVLFKSIQMDGLQKFFGVIDDLASESVLSILAERNGRNERREQRAARLLERGPSLSQGRSVSRGRPRTRSRARR
ncbi:uncharacterized protein LOC117900928 [Drosophila subobscura]|uniref:uncharacterized protein LOC117900928 n=1 Tax=Drosophila subobscura TaxID=7241 RepID=UPI00155B085E|nr:uncharacterized protein LOC117900928 [Drosophila subobscura]